MVNVAPAPPNVTDCTAFKDAPVIVTVVPVTPDAGVTFAIDGESYVNVVLADCASGFVTTTLTGPDTPTGRVNTIDVGLTEVTVATAGPTVTIAPLTKSVPSIVTEMPPAVVPLFGVMFVIVGLEMRVNVSALLLKAPEVAMTGWPPGGTVGTVA